MLMSFQFQDLISEILPEMNILYVMYNSSVMFSSQK
jgi:hypothetical protein